MLEKIINISNNRKLLITMYILIILITLVLVIYLRENNINTLERLLEFIKTGKNLECKSKIIRKWEVGKMSLNKVSLIGRPTTILEIKRTKFISRKFSRKLYKFLGVEYG